MPILISYAYPEASLDRLKTCLDYLTLAFIFEEITYVWAYYPNTLTHSNFREKTSSTQSQRWADLYMDMYRRTPSVHPELEEVENPLFPIMTR